MAGDTTIHRWQLSPQHFGMAQAIPKGGCVTLVPEGVDRVAIRRGNT